MVGEAVEDLLCGLVPYVGVGLASAFVLVGLWFARALPGEALAKEDGVVPVGAPAAGEALA